MIIYYHIYNKEFIMEGENFAEWNRLKNNIDMTNGTNTKINSILKPIIKTSYWKIIIDNKRKLSEKEFDIMFEFEWKTFLVIWYYSISETNWWFQDLDFKSKHALVDSISWYKGFFILKWEELEKITKITELLLNNSQINPHIIIED